ncbi:MAG: hypothetical protein IJJ41_08230 [Clostridia bacterium]|nr:hypothetical protein [Clostridia bacterium]
MKTKNMRKKALVSSLAMLLVAVVALSGATYAWFSANSTANLSAVKLTSTKASSLLIAVKDTEPAASEYSSVVSVNWEQPLIPLSSVSGNTGFMNVIPSNTKADGDNQLVAEIKASQSGFLKKTLWFKSDAAANVKLTSAAINTTSGSETLNLSSAIRIALCANGGTPQVYTMGNADTNKAITAVDNTFTADTVTYGQLYAGTTGLGVSFSDVTAQAAGSSSTPFVSIGSDGGAKQVDLYIWLEGNDSACTNAISGGIITGLEFQFDA